MPSEARYTVNRTSVAAEMVDGEVIVIDLASGVYYSLAGTGALVWALLERGCSVGEVAADLVERFGVSPEQVHGDLAHLVDELVAEEILIPANGQEPAGRAGAEPPALTAYEQPALEKYSDMSDLLALDPPMPGLTDIPWQARGA